MPVPLHLTYVGNGNLQEGVHPSPWLNPFSPSSTTSPEAMQRFYAYSTDRADAAQWLGPLFGATLVAEEGIAGAHADVLVELVSSLCSNEQKKKTDTNQPLTRPRIWKTRSTKMWFTPGTLGA